MTGKARAAHILPTDIPAYVVKKLTEDNLAIDRVIKILESQSLENSLRISTIEKADTKGR